MSLTEHAWSRLHEVRLKGMVQGAEDEHTTVLVEAGFAARRGAATVLTAVGREVHAEWARLPEGSEEAATARRAYDQFLLLDRDVKELTTAWQMGAANARPDGYTPEEWKIIDRLTAVDEKAGPILLKLGRAVPRFAPYRARLSRALSQLEEGDRRWLSGLTCDSYHTVWWQLHEDLLTALAIDRSDDPNQ